MLDSITMEVGGKSYIFRPTCEALELIEDRMSRTVFQVVHLSLRTPSLKIGEVIDTMHVLLLLKGEKFTRDEVAKMIMKQGTMLLMRPILQLFTSAVMAGPEDPEDLPPGDTKSDGE